MANLNRKERRAQRNESNTIGILLRLFFGLSFIGLAVVLFGELDYNYIVSIYAVNIVVSLIYVVMNKSRITTSLAVHTNVRMIIAYLIMLITMFFYAFALLRANQFSTPMQATLFIGGAIVYLAVFNSTKAMLTKQD
ncbi:CAAX protease [Veillonella sp.]|uniref:CAAX protease n=1 Tax=Veillonella sp. TaxID=1926307 RepID=UPI00258FEE9B|nr:CAAX protease [Veillonella sp.]MDU4572312.1 CAAX protease [Veillonella sp.]MDU5494943.1 CAAX protease [Veillonella sp.]